jgi:hypothetical protein
MYIYLMGFICLFCLIQGDSSIKENKYFLYERVLPIWPRSWRPRWSRTTRSWTSFSTRACSSWKTSFRVTVNLHFHEKVEGSMLSIISTFFSLFGYRSVECLVMPCSDYFRVWMLFTFWVIFAEIFANVSKNEVHVGKLSVPVISWNRYLDHWWP